MQRLVRTTGDPAVSPDGRFVALTIRTDDAPSAARGLEDRRRAGHAPPTRRARRSVRRDPQDVPDRRFYPPPKRVVITLVRRRRRAVRDAALVRRQPAPARHAAHAARATAPCVRDLFIWNAEDGSLSRVTHGAGAARRRSLAATARWAAAVRCEHGWCDLVRVDLATAASASSRREASPATTIARASRIAPARSSSREQSGDRWRIARVSSHDGELRYADPDDGVTRYDATFDVDGRTIVATSEARWLPQPRAARADGARRSPLTRVTGAAVAADVAPDGAIWFLIFTRRGYDLRRIRPDSAPIDTPLPTLVLGDTISGVIPPPHAAARDSASLPPSILPSTERRYGFGPSRVRFLPAGMSAFGGSTAALAIARSDPVGRFGFLLQGAAGAGAYPAGGSVALVSRANHTYLGINGWSSHEAPSRILPIALEEGLDLSRAGGGLRLDSRRFRDGGELTGTLALLAESQRADRIP